MTHVTLAIGRSHRTLTLDRMCVYLRFVVQGCNWDTLDALNEVGDQARPGETIIPAKLDGGISRGFACSRGKGCKVFQSATYRPIDCPLTQEQMADNQQWAAWCMAQPMEGDPC